MVMHQNTFVMFLSRSVFTKQISWLTFTLGFRGMLLSL